MERGTFIPRFLLSLLLATPLLFASCRKDQVPVREPEAEEEPGGGKKNTTINAKVPAIEVLQTPANGTFIIVNRKSGKVLDVASAATANNSNVLQYGGTGGTNEKWTLTALSGGYYSIIGVGSGRALEVYNAGTANSDNVDIYDYSGGTHQQWSFVSIGNGFYRIVNRNSGLDLDVAGQSVADGANVAQYAYWGGENQQWGLQIATYSGQLGWTLTSTGVPSDALTRITNAMNGAVARYNANYNWASRTLTVEYNTGVATADGSTNGNIRFGSNSSYQTTCTAMHEIAHTYGVGISSGWTANISGGLFIGTNAVDVLATFDGSSAVINTGGGHFWPYGLNYETEWSEASGYRHVKIVAGMKADGM